MTFNLDEYVDVPTRIAEFKAKYPEGSLQSELMEVRDAADELIGWGCKAYAYRTPDDERPGIGHAVESVPGSTPYTRGSEAMNAETSAWGRAIVALGFPTKKIASAEEAQARQSSGEPSATRPSGEVEANEGATGGAAPVSPDNPVAKAQAAAMAAKTARTPQDDGNPANVVFTFGKHKGKTLAETPDSYLDWLTKNYEPHNEDQRRILAAANVLLGNDQVAFGASWPDDIPFAPSVL